MQPQNTTSLAVAQQQLEAVCNDTSLARLLLAGLLAARGTRWRATLVLVGRFAWDWAKALVNAVEQPFVSVPVGKDDIGATARRHLLNVVMNRHVHEPGIKETVQSSLVFELSGVLSLPYWVRPLLVGRVVPTDGRQLRPPGLVVVIGERELAIVHGDMPGVEPREAPSGRVLAELKALGMRGALPTIDEAEFGQHLSTLCRLKDCLEGPVAQVDQPLLDVLADAFNGRGFRAGEALAVVENSPHVFPWLHAGTPEGRRNQLSSRLVRLADAPGGEPVVTYAFSRSVKANVFRVVRVGAVGGGGSEKKRKASNTPRTPPQGTARRGGAS